jgi:hypothetical protein
MPIGHDMAASEAGKVATIGLRPNCLNIAAFTDSA